MSYSSVEALWCMLPASYRQEIDEETARTWLSNDQSLTALLLEYAPGAVQFVLKQRKKESLTASQAALLPVALEGEAWVREVVWQSHQVEWIHATTIIPVVEHSPSFQALCAWREKPLGELLFRDQQLQCGFFSYDFSVIGEAVWVMRQRCFQYKGHPLLVQERFATGFFQDHRQAAWCNKEHV